MARLVVLAMVCVAVAGHDSLREIKKREVNNMVMQRYVRGAPGGPPHGGGPNHLDKAPGWVRSTLKGQPRAEFVRQAPPTTTTTSPRPPPPKSFARQDIRATDPAARYESYPYYPCDYNWNKKCSCSSSSSSSSCCKCCDSCSSSEYPYKYKYCYGRKGTKLCNSYPSYPYYNNAGAGAQAAAP